MSSHVKFLMPFECGLEVVLCFMCYSRASDRSNSGQRDILKPSEMLWSLVATAKWHSKVAKSWHLPQAEGFKKDFKQLGRDIFFYQLHGVYANHGVSIATMGIEGRSGVCRNGWLGRHNSLQAAHADPSKDTTPVNWSHQVSDPFGKVQVMGNVCT